MVLPVVPVVEEGFVHANVVLDPLADAFGFKDTVAFDFAFSFDAVRSVNDDLLLRFVLDFAVRFVDDDLLLSIFVVLDFAGSFFVLDFAVRFVDDDLLVSLVASPMVPIAARCSAVEVQC